MIIKKCLKKKKYLDNNQQFTHIKQCFFTKEYLKKNIINKAYFFG